MFFYFQKEGGNDRWNHDLLESRAKIIQTVQPRYVSALALTKPIDADTPAAEIEKMKYAGPFYVDFDSKEIAFGIRQLNAFLDKLQAHDVNLASVSLYATGGRGFHVEVPPETFLAKLPKDGVESLPHILKEVAFKLYVDSLDMRVYSSKRGRMWRTPNVQRENGAYKVPISLAEARAMTPEVYAEVCKSPRRYVSAAALSEVEEDPSYVPAPEKPALALGLRRLYVEAEIKVKEGLKRRRNSAKQVSALAKFGGDYPPTIAAMLLNLGLKPGAGWNQIALQLAIVGNSLGKQHDDVVESARLLIDNHSGDGGRYGTPAKREEQLRFQLAYTYDNPTYEFSVGAIKVLLTEDVAALDLEGVTDEAAAADIQRTREENADIDFEDRLDMGVVIGIKGITQKISGEWKTWTNVGFDKVSMMMAPETGRPVGFIADIYYRGERKGRATCSLDSFLSRQKFHAFITSQTGGPFHGTDPTVWAIQEAFVLKSRAFAQEHGVEYVISREGLDIVSFAANVAVPEEAREPFPVWASATGCIVPERITNAGMSFSYMGRPNLEGISKTDLMQAPQLEKSEKLIAVLDAIHHMNRPRSVAPMLGWLVAAHARMFYHRYMNQFPILAVAGESGAGKSTTLLALSSLHFYKRDMPDLHVLSSTPAGIENRIATSASIPIQLEEYKPRDMTPERVGRFRAALRGAYNNGMVSKAGGEQVQLTGARQLTETSLSGPVVFLGEALEPETAIVERTVQCAFDRQGKHGRERHLQLLQREGRILSSIGREVVRCLLDVKFEDFCDDFDRCYEIVRQKMEGSDNARIIFNYAVALHGLSFLQSILESVDIDCTEMLEEFRAAVLLGPITLGTEVVSEGVDGKKNYTSKSEAAKVLSAMATASFMGSQYDEAKMLVNTDYAFDETPEGVEIFELCLPMAWAKYQISCGRKRVQPLYDSEEAFSFGMRNFVGFFDTQANVLKDFEGVYRFRVDKLREANVGAFKRAGGIKRS